MKPFSPHLSPPAERRSTPTTGDTVSCRGTTVPLSARLSTPQGKDTGVTPLPMPLAFSSAAVNFSPGDPGEGHACDPEQSLRFFSVAQSSPSGSHLADLFAPQRGLQQPQPCAWGRRGCQRRGSTTPMPSRPAPQDIVSRARQGGCSPPDHPTPRARALCSSWSRLPCVRLQEVSLPERAACLLPQQGPHTQLSTSTLLRAAGVRPGHSQALPWVGRATPRPSSNAPRTTHPKALCRNNGHTSATREHFLCRQSRKRLISHTCSWWRRCMAMWGSNQLLYWPPHPRTPEHRPFPISLPRPKILG